MTWLCPSYLAGNSTKAWEDMAVASLAVPRWRCGPNPSLGNAPSQQHNYRDLQVQRHCPAQTVGENGGGTILPFAQLVFKPLFPKNLGNFTSLFSPPFCVSYLNRLQTT